jgi:hypothetical protein
MHNVEIWRKNRAEVEQKIKVLVKKLQDKNEKFECRNPSLRFITKVRACEGASQEKEARESHSMLLGVQENEGMNPHTPK